MARAIFDGGAVGNDFVDVRCGLGLLPVRGCDGRSCRRDIDVKTVHDDAREMAGTHKYVDIVGYDSETLNRNHRRRSRATAKPPESEALSDAPRGGGKRYGGISGK